MPNDLDIIAQIEERIGRKLLRLDEITWNSVDSHSFVPTLPLGTRNKFL